MRSLVSVGLMAIAVIALMNFVGGISGQEEQQRKKAPPLSLDGLLDEKLPDAKDQEPTHADNESCYVCHANYKDEELVIRHGQDDVGCIDCHGASEAHRNDEDNVTPPDKMFALGDIEDMCIDCHDSHDVTAKDVLKRWQTRCSNKTDPNTIVCTDCHFHHRLAFRTVWWDKKTGKLVVRKKGERVKKSSAVAAEGQN